jgi:hypothetical protein
MFAAEIEQVGPSGRRRSARRAVSLDAAIGRTLCKVTDISHGGARLQTYSALRRGAVIWLTLPGSGQHAAEVVWADDFVAGCRFHAELTATEFSAVVACDAEAARR